MTAPPTTALTQIDCLYSAVQIQQRVAEIAAQIDTDYQRHGGNLVLVGLLRGAVMLLADLSRALHTAHSLDFMSVASYGNQHHSSGQLRLLKDLDDSIAGRHVLIVEDIIDTGHTLQQVLALLAERQPASLQVCTLLDKPSRRQTAIEVRYVGFQIEDVFVIGYGMDDAQQYRQLPYVGVKRSNAHLD